MGLVAYLSLSGSGREVGWGGRLFEAGRLLTFSAFGMGAYSRWALIRGWALNRINTVFACLFRFYDKIIGVSIFTCLCSIFYFLSGWCDDIKWNSAV